MHTATPLSELERAIQFGDAAARRAKLAASATTLAGYASALDRTKLKARPKKRPTPMDEDPGQAILDRWVDLSRPAKTAATPIAPRTSRVTRGGGKPTVTRFDKGHTFQGSRTAPLKGAAKIAAMLAGEKQAEKVDLEKKPGPLQSRHMANLMGIDSQIEAARQTLRSGETGLHALAARAGIPAGLAARRAATHQATNMPTRLLGDLVLGDGLGGVVLDAASAAGGGDPNKRDQVREWWRTSGLDAARDPVPSPDEAPPPTTRETPWHRAMQANFADSDYDVAFHRWNRQQRPANYWLNPLDKTGPLNELGTRLSRRMFAGIAAPESTLARALTVATPFLGAFRGTAYQQNRMRATADKNKLYGAGEGEPVSAEERAQAVKTKREADTAKRPKDGDGDGEINDDTPAAKAAAYMRRRYGERNGPASADNRNKRLSRC